MTEYAIYKGDELLVIGTKHECATELGVKPETIYWMSTPAAQRKLDKRKNPSRCKIAVRLDDDE